MQALEKRVYAVRDFYSSVRVEANAGVDNPADDRCARWVD